MTDRRLAVAAWESLFRAQHEVLHEISGDFSDDDLTQAEYDVLLTVTRGDDHAARLRDVTANMLISQPSVSRLVDRMVARRLIEKGPDPLDGRGAHVGATHEGHAALPPVAAAAPTRARGAARRGARPTRDSRRSAASRRRTPARSPSACRCCPTPNSATCRP